MGRMAAAISSEGLESVRLDKYRIWSVAAELLLLVFCFALAIYTTQTGPRRYTVPQPANPAQQTQSPRDSDAPLTAPLPPGGNSGEAVAII